VSRSNKIMRVLAVLLVAALLSACSEYLARRDTIAESGGDAVATNKVVHMVDPWPVYSNDRNLAFNGQKMQNAVERYRNNRAITPRGIGTTSSYQSAQPESGGGGAANNSPVGPTITQPAAAVK